MPFASGTINSTTTYLACQLLEGENTILIEISAYALAGAGPLIVQFSSAGSSFTAIDVSFVQSMDSGGSTTLNTNGRWIVQLPGPGYVRVAPSHTPTVGQTANATINSWNILGAAVGQPAALTNVYLVQIGGSPHQNYSSIVGDCSGGVQPVTIQVPDSSTPGSSVATLITAALGAGVDTDWAWAVFFDVQQITQKYAAVSGICNILNTKTYPVGVTLDVCPVPPEFLQNLLGNLTAEGAMETVLMDDGAKPTS